MKLFIFALILTISTPAFAWDMHSDTDKDGTLDVYDEKPMNPYDS